MESPPASPARGAAKTLVPVVLPEQVRAARGAVVIDLRTGSEYADDHWPGAHNVPLLDDAGRAVVGTLYRQVSPEAAFEEGRHRVEERIAALVEAIAAVAGWEAPAVDLGREVEERTRPGFARLGGELAVERAAELPERPVVLYCWRGGMRSRSVIALLRDLGLKRAVGLEGGYKAYRAHVLRRLDAWRFPPAVVLHGLTGVGKTLVLRALERRCPGWTIDLEAIAGHRSSILGMVGLAPCTQKTFDSRLHARLEAGFPEGVAVVEGESRKVGDSIVPASLWRAMRAGASVELVAPLERRVDVLIADYLGREGNRDELRRQLPFIEERLGPVRWKGELVRRLDDGRERELVAILLERYYDPLYRHTERDLSHGLRVDAAEPERAAEDIADWVRSRLR